MHEWMTTLLTAVLGSIIPAAILVLASRRKTSAETSKIGNDDLRATNALLLQDNAQLREALSKFDEELLEIRTNMATMCSGYSAELDKLRADNAALRVQIASLEESVRQRDAHITSLEKQIRSQGMRITELETENLALKSLLKKEMGK